MRSRAPTVLLLLALAASHAMADDTQPATKPQPKQAEWYGNRMLTVDVLAGLTLIGGFALLARAPSDNALGTILAEGSIFAFAGIAYLANGPVVHGRVGKRGRAWQSFALRLLVTPLAIVIGKQVYSRNANSGNDELLFLSAGLVATSAIDIGLLARRF